MQTFEYKIRHKVTGCFQCSGTWVNWSEKGKVWKTKAALSNHLRLVIDSKFNHKRDFENWEIVVYKVTSSVYSTSDYHNFYQLKV